MLYSIDNLNHAIIEMPHHKEYSLWRSRLSDEEYQAIINELDKRTLGTEIQTSSWIPGNNWSGTTFEPIYSKACNFDEEQSGLFFGLLVWDYFENHRKDDWSFGRYEKDGIPIQGITYFKIDRSRII